MLQGAALLLTVLRFKMLFYQNAAPDTGRFLLILYAYI